MTDATVSPAQFWSGLRRLVVTGSVEVLLRAAVFGLVLSQYVFGGSLLPFTFSFALAYAVFALAAPMIYAISTRFPGPGLVLTCAAAIFLVDAVLMTLHFTGLINPWIVGAIAPVLLVPTVIIYRALRNTRKRFSPPIENSVDTLIGDGVEGLVPEIVAGVVLILFGRPGVLVLGVVGAMLALADLAAHPKAVQAQKAEGTGATLGQVLNDVNLGLTVIFQRPRLANIQLAAMGANFFLGVLSSLLFPLSLLRGDGRPDVFLWLQGGALVGLLVGSRVYNSFKKQLERPLAFFGGFIVAGLVSLVGVSLVAPVAFWAIAYSFLFIVSMASILPLFAVERRPLPVPVRQLQMGAADLVSFSVSVIGIATAGIVIERMLTPALAPGGVLEPWLTPLIGSGPAAPIAAYWLFGGVALAAIGVLAWANYVRQPIGAVATGQLVDEVLMAPPRVLGHPIGRTAAAIAVAALASVMIATGLAVRAGELYTVALSVCAVVYVLVSALLWVGHPRARPGASDAALTFALIGVGLAALVAGPSVYWVAVATLPIGAGRLPRLGWLPTTGAQVPLYVSGVIRVVGGLGLVVAGANQVALFGPESIQTLSLWLTALMMIIGGVVFVLAITLRFLATHRSAQRTQLGLLTGGAALPLTPAILGSVLLAYVVPELLSAAPGWVSAAVLFSLLTPVTFGFVFWNPATRMVRLERRLAPVLWISAVATLYVLASLALRGWGAPWAIDVALAIGGMLLVVVGLRDWTTPLAAGRASELERALLRRPTLEAVDQALVELCDALGVPGLILAHEQPGRPGWMLRRALETESLSLDEAALPPTPPEDCLVASDDRAREGWLAAPWVAVAQPIRVEDQPPLGCLLLPRRSRPYANADLKRAADVAEALAAPLQVIALRWAALRPYREREQAQREERTRIARRLHAEVLQSLAPLPGYLAIAAQRSEDASLRDMLARQEQEVMKVDDAIRQVVTAIRPASLNAPLALLMEQALRRAATEAPETQYHSDIQLSREFDLPVEAKWPVHNIVDNALSNARKHAQAKNIWLTLRREGLHLVLVVEDDGVGIPLKDGETDALTLIRNGHFGLADMLDDAEQLNGRLAIGRRMAGGTYVRLWFPVGVDK